jgi:hypothetical protein
MKKIILYPKSAMKPIILSDDNEQDIEVLKEAIFNVLKSDKIGIITTKTDCLIVRPSEIQAVLITKDREHLESDKKYHDKLEISDGDNSHS